MSRNILYTGPTRAAKTGKNLLYRHDEPNEPTKEGPLSSVLRESPFVSVSTAPPISSLSDPTTSSFLSLLVAGWWLVFKKSEVRHMEYTKKDHTCSGILSTLFHTVCRKSGAGICIILQNFMLFPNFLKWVLKTVPKKLKGKNTFEKSAKTRNSRGILHITFFRHIFLSPFQRILVF
jgi:hypothetical protein